MKTLLNYELLKIKIKRHGSVLHLTVRDFLTDLYIVACPPFSACISVPLLCFSMFFDPSTFSFGLENFSFNLLDQFLNFVPILCSLFGVLGIFDGDVSFEIFDSSFEVSSADAVSFVKKTANLLFSGEELFNSLESILELGVLALFRFSVELSERELLAGVNVLSV